MFHGAAHERVFHGAAYERVFHGVVYGRVFHGAVYGRYTPPGLNSSCPPMGGTSEKIILVCQPSILRAKKGRIMKE